MKKVIYVFIVCLILLSFTFYFYMNKDLSSNLFKKVYDKYEEKFGEKLEPYDTNFVINGLSKKSDNYYYNTLSEGQKAIYTSIANAVKNLNNNFKLVGYEYLDETTTNKDIEVALYRFLLDHPEVFYINDKYTISTSTSIFGTKVNLVFEYLVSSQEELDTKIEKINNAIGDVMANVKEDYNEYETELAIHDYLGKNIEYYEYEKIEDIPQNCHNIYGALVEKKAVCDGFSKSLKLLLERENISTIVVTGNLKNESHAWNKVKLDDNWYNLDLTSDKSIKTDKKSYVIHSYFNITDKLILKTHSVDNEELHPKAEKTDKNYYYVAKKVIEKSDNFSDKFSDILSKNDNGDLLEFLCEDSGVPDKIANSLSYRHYDSGYVDKNSSKFSYYNVLNTYILLKLS